MYVYVGGECGGNERSDFFKKKKKEKFELFVLSYYKNRLCV